MTKLKKPLLSWGAKGSLDGTTFQARHRTTVAREKPFPRNPKSDAQLAQRQKYHDAVDAWNALSPEEKDQWRGVCPGLTAYQCFMSAELKKAAPPPPPPQEKTEEQTEHNYTQALYHDSIIKSGQRLTIPNRKVIKLGFWLTKVGSPTGHVTFEIRRIDPDEVIAAKLWGDAADLPSQPTYHEVQFDTPLTINEEVRIVVSYSGGSGATFVGHRMQDTDVKADEYVTRSLRGTWYPLTSADSAYRYKYYEA